MTSPCETTESLWHVFSGGGGVGVQKQSNCFSWLLWTTLQHLYTRKQQKKILKWNFWFIAHFVVCNWQWCYRCSHLRNLTFDCTFTDLLENTPLSFLWERLMSLLCLCLKLYTKMNDTKTPQKWNWSVFITPGGWLQYSS